MSNLHRILVYCPVFPPKQNFCQYQQKNVQKLKLNFYCIAPLHTNTKVCLMYFDQDCLWKKYFAFNSSQSPSKLICFTVLVTLTLLDVLINMHRLKRSILKANQMPFFNKELSKAIMTRTKLRNIFLQNRNEENRIHYTKLFLSFF